MLFGGHVGGHLGFLELPKDIPLISASYALLGLKWSRIHQEKNFIRRCRVYPSGCLTTICFDIFVCSNHCQSIWKHIVAFSLWILFIRIVLIILVFIVIWKGRQWPCHFLPKASHVLWVLHCLLLSICLSVCQGVNLELVCVITCDHISQDHQIWIRGAKHLG